MEDEPRASGTGRLVSCVAWTLLLAGLWLWGRQLTEGGGWLPGSSPGAAQAQAAGARGSLPPAADPLAAGVDPAVLEIEAIGVRADIMARGIDEGGGVAPPPDGEPGLVGWYAGGPVPGAEGAAVLVGHVDTETDPAVFYALSSVEPGDGVRVVRDDGSVAAFTVSGTEVVERADFDPERVYGPRQDGAAELRLITCGGTYDAQRREYSANVVVSAYLTDSAGGRDGAVDGAGPA
ncbi:class F sortase [Streptomyces xiamenensis]|uniref:class F sortase n=1 Tax=Streptomyces xiamenensis TaxID=408015 RepID=UPI0034443E0F